MLLTSSRKVSWTIWVSSNKKAVGLSWHPACSPQGILCQQLACYSIWPALSLPPTWQSMHAGFQAAHVGLTKQMECVHADLPVEVLEILPELNEPVPLGDLDGEAPLLRNIGGQPAEALPPAPTYAHQQGIAAGLHEHPVDAADMQQCIPACRHT